MQEGTVKFFDNVKGFGFIKSSKNGEDIFVHSSGLNSDIKENDKVTFDTQEGRRGINAVNVQVID